MAGDPRQFRTHTVWTRALWADAWTQQEDIYCENLLFTCGPDFNKAELSYLYGNVEGYGEASVAQRLPKSINDYYVKVILTQTDLSTIVWYGIIVDTERINPGNGWNVPGDAAKSWPESGRQKFTAVGLEWLLEREIYDSSWAVADETAGVKLEWEYQRGIAFNMGGGGTSDRRLVGNRSADVSDDTGVYLFNRNLDDAQEWTAWEIIEYLLTYHAPEDSVNHDHLGWTLAGDAKDSETLGAIRPKLDAHGRSVKGILDAICDRRRGLSWKVAVNDTTNTASVEVIRFGSEDILLDGGDFRSGWIRANEDTVEIDVASDPRVLSAPLVTSTSSQFDVVVARGAPMTLTLSLQETPSAEQGSVIKDWTDALETEYNDAATAGSGYGALKDPAKQGWNAAYRHGNKLERVYSYFLWDPELVFTEVGAILDDVPELLDTRVGIWPPGARFLNNLAIKYDVTYTTPSESLPTDKPDASVDEYVRPFAVVKDQGRYFPLHSLDQGDVVDAILRQWSGDLAMRHDQLGMKVDISGPPGQHAIADDEFAQADSTDVNPYSDISPSQSGRVRWQEMIFTVTVELDNFSEAQHPSPTDVLTIGRDAIRTLVIPVPDRRFEYVAKNTVFGLDAAGALLKTSKGGWIRYTDDYHKLQWVALAAYNWYSTQRYAFEQHFRSLDCSYFVGQLVTNLVTVGAALDADKTKLESNSVITSIAFDVRGGSFNLKTSFADLDARSMVL